MGAGVLASKAIDEQRAQQGPPQDPRVQAATINAQAKAEDRDANVALKRQQLEHDTQESQADRESDLLIKGMEREIQLLEFSGRREISLEQIRALLASKSLDIRNKREMQASEIAFAQSTGEGRGL